jgi:hypothetical protein
MEIIFIFAMARKWLMTLNEHSSIARARLKFGEVMMEIVSISRCINGGSFHRGGDLYQPCRASCADGVRDRTGNDCLRPQLQTSRRMQVILALTATIAGALVWLMNGDVMWLIGALCIFWSYPLP